jgi:chitodextrinase
MSVLTLPPVDLQTCPPDLPSVPAWFAEVVVMARHFSQRPGGQRGSLRTPAPHGCGVCAGVHWPQARGSRTYPHHYSAGAHARIVGHLLGGWKRRRHG